MRGLPRSCGDDRDASSQGHTKRGGKKEVMFFGA
jgi:hypothetical protein